MAKQDGVTVLVYPQANLALANSPTSSGVTAGGKVAR